ncbi:MAG: ribonuclease H-like domain-containing protein [Thermoguttaceae bacterium]|jgi:DNA polymerase elongation subunit (family B)
MSKIYFDTETTSLNPHNKEAKLLTIQLGIERKDGLQLIVFSTEFNTEFEVINKMNMLFKEDRFTPIFTYNGLFDILYLMGRCDELGNKALHGNIIQLFNSHLKHCDLMQYNNGYFMSLDSVCLEYGIKGKSKFSGKDVYSLYRNDMFNDIIEHGKDDIMRLYRLVHETTLADRFLI